MKAIMLMFDSLNRRMLSPYGCDWVHTPNFQRLADRTVTFDTAYVGSMPCMPARRELHTGRYNFLHRSWGPLEPFDDSMPALLREQAVHTHLVSDHYHYWEEGGATYHTRFSTWDNVRGQEGDPWIADLRPLDLTMNPRDRDNPIRRQDAINRFHMPREENHPQAQTFRLGMEFLRRNCRQDNWFLQLETFDPHEPYFSPERFKALYPHAWDGPHWDWPSYARVTESPEAVQHMRCLSAALHTMCDEYLGRVLDLMDELQLWDDTLLIVNTDHGFLLGEHDWWAKVVQPFYDEVAHAPLFIWDPRSRTRGERRQSLVQTIDLAPTVLDFFGLEYPPDMQGCPLASTIAGDRPVREAGLFGVHGGQVNVTDGRYVYMRSASTPDNNPIHNYTLMPTHMRRPFTCEELRTAELAPPFAFTKGCPSLRLGAGAWGGMRQHEFETVLYDLQADPHQQHPLVDRKIEQRMIGHLVRLMHANDAPPEQYQRLGLPLPAEVASS